MNEDNESNLEWGKRDRLLARVDHMVDAGRLTGEEAQRLRLATQPSQFDEVVRGIRVRHASAKLDVAVADGSITRAEADGLLERLGRGEHGRALRARLRALLPRGVPRTRGSDPDARPGDSQ